MPITRFESVLDLIDNNLSMNRDEVLAYIDLNQEAVARAMYKDGFVEIPTTAGKIRLERSAVFA